MSIVAKELRPAVGINRPVSDSPVELSIVMPCLNEAETLETCIRKAADAMSSLGISAEIVVADNGSSDGSQQIALELGARVVSVEPKGYGSALMGGIAAAEGRYIIMGDADDSYDFSAIMPFLAKLREGYDLVMGNRFLGGVKAGAMPLLHKYIGNPILSGIGRLFFHTPCKDFHCGLRGFSRDAVKKMNLRTTGMEFASEMVVKATLWRMRIAEIPTTLAPDGRTRPPHLRSFRDGWRHLRFLLMYSPRWLFLYPGVVLILIGLMLSLWLLPGPRTIGGITLDVHTMVFAVAAIFVGFQSVTFSAFTKAFAINEGLMPPDPRVDRLFRIVTLEKGLIAGSIMTLAGCLGSVLALGKWGMESFGEMDPQITLRIVIPSVLLLVLGTQTILSSFFLSILGLGRR